MTTPRTFRRLPKGGSAYRVDPAQVAALLAAWNGPEAKAASIREAGGYARAAFVYVPLRDVQVPPAWNPGRARNVARGIRDDVALPPARLALPPGARRWAVEDGIHRANVSGDVGFTHLPAIVTVWIETAATRRGRVADAAERPPVAPGTWVRLLDEVARRHAGGRVFGRVDELLDVRGVPGARRRIYAVSVFRRPDEVPLVLDLTDAEFGPA